MTETIRLRYLAEVNPSTPEFDRVAADKDVLFMPLESIWADARLDVTRTRLKAEAATGYVRFRPGDVLCPKVTPTFQAGRSAYLGTLPDGLTAGAATTEIHVVRARAGISDPRFLRYGLMSKNFLEEGVSRFQGVAGLQRVPGDFLRDLRLADFPLEEQRRIADFLDDQVTRIDAAITLRRSQLALVAERQGSAIDAALLTEGTPVAPLGILAMLQTGMALNIEEAKPNGVLRPYLRVANVKADRLDLSEVKEVTVTAQELRRHSLRPGDVLMTEGGDLDKLARGTVLARGGGWRSSSESCLCGSPPTRCA